MITMGILGHKRKSSDKRGSAPGGVVESIEDDQTGTSRIGQYPTGQSARDAPSLFLCSFIYLPSRVERQLNRNNQTHNVVDIENIDSN
jgi:hypothetical protein